MYDWDAATAANFLRKYGLIGIAGLTDIRHIYRIIVVEEKDRPGKEGKNIRALIIHFFVRGAVLSLSLFFLEGRLYWDGNTGKIKCATTGTTVEGLGF
ncbi:Hypothetical predicted protein [Olea europaea subsp. europaea]|uniref:Uncharacterized protein n=1 Tax=Olea europaea subsp. europaea TaxID=158383 RepID=A0A8S0PK31_OLEEU|nr:Hypothetical predicted protein [Olea europaea subsp. europaea]